jgi:hypothetical protein
VLDLPDKCALCGLPFSRAVRRSDDPTRRAFEVRGGDLSIARILPGETQPVRVHLRCSSAERVDAAKRKAN